jgi:hypothetical protein
MNRYTAMRARKSHLIFGFTVTDPLGVLTLLLTFLLLIT